MCDTKGLRFLKIREISFRGFVAVKWRFLEKWRFFNFKQIKGFLAEGQTLALLGRWWFLSTEQGEFCQIRLARSLNSV